MSHPETPVRQRKAADVNFILIGFAFDPEAGNFNEEEVLTDIASSYCSRAALLTVLDRLAGRFVLIIEEHGESEVFHDAMGSRSVFYSSGTTPVVASHAEIVARHTGVGLADFVIPFLTSRNYVQRDVKYLPGLATSYDDVRQLTPNTSLRYPEQVVSRYWPRPDGFRHGSTHDATDMLETHLKGLASYLKSSGRRPVMGLTGGTDSRGVFSALWANDPFIFTYVRSQDAQQLSSSDSRSAVEIAGAYGLEVNVWPISNRLSLSAADNGFSYAFRRSTGYYRGPGSPWIDELRLMNFDPDRSLFVRGFGGEIMRGFYQKFSKRIRRVNAYHLADAYDVNAGSTITRRLFEEMLEITNLNEETICGYDPNDIFYWEHRMGTWGSVAMSEADLATPSIVGYNSRNLYSAFMDTSASERDSRVAFDDVTRRLAPRLTPLLDR
ncbi:hypothetical protein BJ994_001712 [Arthrobacter pigmenti]|uniref:Asparagine synthase n=1 Tax=Arthrobacter pigmenti TaxID=271432 RepID=A0A846RUC1_9MICC|nr:hypothetical protein [Arthrobacter pigmenti]NJC22636.1 hypothetical protein [Arthrobacter pigmenti]